MRTTIDIDNDIIEQTINLTGAKTKSQAIRQALEAFIREKQKTNLLKLKGTLKIEENWKRLREMELDES